MCDCHKPKTLIGRLNAEYRRSECVAKLPKGESAFPNRNLAIYIVAALDEVGLIAHDREQAVGPARSAAERVVEELLDEMDGK